MMRKLICVLLTLALVGESIQTAAQITGKEKAVPALDTRVMNKLGQVNLDFTLTEFNGYRVPFQLRSGRQQVAIVDSITEKYLSIEVRQVWSVALSTEKPLAPGLLQRLLLSNTKFGGWRLSLYQGKYTLFFVTFVAAECDAETLRDAMDIVIVVADELEKELTKKDMY
jgi:hypothetical protein